ncbi:ABC transporter, ATP-binding protein [Peptostreptococcus stomatis DSM 17678]|uniref:ABC transporter, ATP-binding protein n=1 Tax=Peptostreptococcus stomatis DSM 17678 TaxID=596315 RepID=E0E4T7_9FIRM|nr:ABC transporter ATP-binding protein [Peptostreptococcus stomatis]EFM64053.1 ABC transporter, ATP-binding protein [Peptostreptococcus stomatis DSM 17678]
MLEVKNVLKRYDDLVALDNLSLDIKKGEVFGLLGPNGSGKTTLINCILSLSKFEKGDIKIFDQPMSADRYGLKAKIGYVPQEIAVFDELSVYDNIDFFCGLYIQDRATRKQYVEDAIEFVGLNDFRKFVPKKLSGGLKRRLNLACGLAHKPELLILDEPTVAVDPQSRNAILEGIMDLNNKGMTVIYTSHYMDEVEQICTRISIIDKGKLLATGDKYELKKLVGLTDTLILKDIDMKNLDLSQLESIEGLGKISLEGSNLSIGIQDNLAMTHIFAYLENNDIFFKGMDIISPSLNDVFLEITGKQLRDDL